MIKNIYLEKLVSHILMCKDKIMMIFLSLMLCLNAGPNKISKDILEEQIARLDFGSTEHRNSLQTYIDIDSDACLNISEGKYHAALLQISVTDDVISVLENWLSIDEDEIIQRLTQGIKIDNCENWREDMNIFIFILMDFVNTVCKETQHSPLFDNVYKILQKVVPLIFYQLNIPSLKERIRATSLKNKYHRFLMQKNKYSQLLIENNHSNQFLIQKNMNQHQKLIRDLLKKLSITPQKTFSEPDYDNMISHLDEFYITDFSVFSNLSDYMEAYKVRYNSFDIVHHEKFQEIIDGGIKVHGNIKNGAAFIIPIYIRLYEIQNSVSIDDSLKDSFLWEYILHDIQLKDIKNSFSCEDLSSGRELQYNKHDIYKQNKNHKDIERFVQSLEDMLNSLDKLNTDQLSQLSMKITAFQDSSVDPIIYIRESDDDRYNLVISRIELTDDAINVLKNWRDFTNYSDAYERLVRGIEILGIENKFDRFMYILALRNAVNLRDKYTRQYPNFQDLYIFFGKVVDTVLDKTNRLYTAKESKQIDSVGERKFHNRHLMQKHRALHHQLMLDLIAVSNPSRFHLSNDEFIDCINALCIDDFFILEVLSSHIDYIENISWKLSISRRLSQDENSLLTMLNSHIQKVDTFADKIYYIMPIYVLLYEKAYGCRLHHKLKDSRLWKNIIYSMLKEPKGPRQTNQNDESMDDFTKLLRTQASELSLKMQDFTLSLKSMLSKLTDQQMMEVKHQAELILNAEAIRFEIDQRSKTQPHTSYGRELASYYADNLHYILQKPLDTDLFHRKQHDIVELSEFRSGGIDASSEREVSDIEKLSEVQPVMQEDLIHVGTEVYPLSDIINNSDLQNEVIAQYINYMSTNAADESYILEKLPLMRQRILDKGHKIDHDNDILLEALTYLQVMKDRKLNISSKSFFPASDKFESSEFRSGGIAASSEQEVPAIAASSKPEVRDIAELSKLRSGGVNESSESSYFAPVKEKDLIPCNQGFSHLYHVMMYSNLQDKVIDQYTTYMSNKSDEKEVTEENILEKLPSMIQHIIDIGCEIDNDKDILLRAITFAKLIKDRKLTISSKSKGYCALPETDELKSFKQEVSNIAESSHTEPVIVEDAQNKYDTSLTSLEEIIQKLDISEEERQKLPSIKEIKERFSRGCRVWHHNNLYISLISKFHIGNLMQLPDQATHAVFKMNYQELIDLKVLQVVSNTSEDLRHRFDFERFFECKSLIDHTFQGSINIDIDDKSKFEKVIESIPESSGMNSVADADFLMKRNIEASSQSVKEGEKFYETDNTPEETDQEFRGKDTPKETVDTSEETNKSKKSHRPPIKPSKKVKK